ncbi:MAG: CYTH and CHAD domain-containing protein [Gallionella sp.]
MAVETELKLRVSPEQFARLRRHAMLKAHSLTRPVTRRLYNIYYDTPKLDLYRSGMALRLRRTGRQWLQTLKGGGSVKAGLHQRSEWEVRVRGAALDFSGLAAEWDVHLPASRRKRLRPVFVTDFSRTSRMLLWQGAQIELCMDQGMISTEQRSTQLCELELELKSGDPQQLFALAQALLDIVPFELEAVSKAEQGYRLLSGYLAHPVRSVAPVLAETDTLAEVLKTQIWSCLQHFQNNLSGAMDGDDAEYLHQMRVALRRLRVVLRMAEKFRSDENLAALNRDISALFVTLGRIREWDVFIAQTMQPLCTQIKGHPGLQALLAAAMRQRSACHAVLRDAVQARELQRLLLRFAVWMHGDYWQHTEWHQAVENRQEVQNFASHRLRKLAKQFARSARHPDSVDSQQLHALRILAKKLRYSAEIFLSLYDRRKTKPVLAALGGVQDVLGQVNDDVAAQRLLDKLAGDECLAAHQEAIVLSRGWITQDLSGQLAALRKSTRHFNKQAVFWKK